MAIEQPFLIAFIARLENAKYNLAAFGIAYSFAIIVEAPVIMLISASTALVTETIPTENSRNSQIYLMLLSPPSTS